MDIYTKENNGPLYIYHEDLNMICIVLSEKYVMYKHEKYITETEYTTMLLADPSIEIIEYKDSIWSDISSNK